MKSFEEYSRMAENAISAINLPLDEFPSLYSPVTYSLEAGGKRLRPVLLMMGAEACGLDASEVLDAAVGIETFHNFTLLHDDVMDRSPLRRGRPSVHAKWDENTAILSGDAMLTLATEWISCVADNTLRKVLAAFNRTALDVYEGQAKDMEFETRDDVTLPEYMEMIADKTSALLGGAVKIGALAAGASDATSDALYDYALNIGLAFQIKDDWLDVFGDSATFGKPIGGDILNRKKTFLLISAYSAGEDIARSLDEAFDTLEGEALIGKVRNIYVSAGIPKLCDDAVEAYRRKAVESLDKADICEDAKTAFAQLAERLSSRVK